VLGRDNESRALRVRSVERAMQKILIISNGSSIGAVASAIEEFGGQVETAHRMVIPRSDLGRLISGDEEGPVTVIEATYQDLFEVFEDMLRSACPGTRLYPPVLSRRIIDNLFRIHHSEDERRLFEELSREQTASA